MVCGDAISLSVDVMRRSISSIACPICAFRRSCVVAASCRVSSVRARRSDSRALHLLRIADRPRVLLRALALEVFHPLLNSRFRVDQSFASVTHAYAAPVSVVDAHYKMDRVTPRPNSDPLALFHPAVRAWFASAFDAPTRPQTLGWPAIARGESTLILAPTGSGKTLTAFLWCLDRLMFAPQPPKAGAAACSTSRRSRRWRSTSSATCARRSPASRTWPTALGEPLRDAGDRDPDRRHAGGRARALPARAGRHPDHDARIAVPAADVERARGAALGRHDHHRRNPRARADQARRASRAVARTARGALRAPAAAHRPVGDAAAARRSRPVPRRRRIDGRGAPARGGTPRQGRRRERAEAERRATSSRRIAARALPPRHHRRRRREEGAAADDRGAGRGHGAAERRRTTSRAARRRSAIRGRRSGRRSIRGCSS